MKGSKGPKLTYYNSFQPCIGFLVVRRHFEPFHIYVYFLQNSSHKVELKKFLRFYSFHGIFHFNFQMSQGDKNLWNAMSFMKIPEYAATLCVGAKINKSFRNY